MRKAPHRGVAGLQESCQGSAALGRACPIQWVVEPHWLSTTQSNSNSAAQILPAAVMHPSRQLIELRLLTREECVGFGSRGRSHQSSPRIFFFSESREGLFGQGGSTRVLACPRIWYTSGPLYRKRTHISGKPLVQGPLLAPNHANTVGRYASDVPWEPLLDNSVERWSCASMRASDGCHGDAPLCGSVEK